MMLFGKRGLLVEAHINGDRLVSAYEPVDP